MIRRIIDQCIASPDTYCLELTYTDRQGHRTRRTVSPIRWTSRTQFLALCLCREEVRQFDLSRCDTATRIASSSVLMPTPIIDLGDA